MKEYSLPVPSKKRPKDKVVWVAQVVVSDKTVEKIRSAHHLEPRDIIDAIASPPAQLGRRDRDNPAKVYLEVRINGQTVLVVLYDAGDDVWNLASAYVIAGQQGA
jgi:hypothetical protein